MDALFIGRKSSAGRSIRSPLFGSLLFGEDDDVDQFVEQHPTTASSRGNQKDTEVRKLNTYFLNIATCNIYDLHSCEFIAMII